MYIITDLNSFFDFFLLIDATCEVIEISCIDLDEMEMRYEVVDEVT